MYELRLNEDKRYRESEVEFDEGMFGRSDGVYLNKDIKNDNIIKDYKKWKKWKEEVENKKRKVEEKRLFEMSKKMKEILKNV